MVVSADDWIMTLDERLALCARHVALGIDPLLELAEVLSLTRMSRATLYRRVAEGAFPAPRKNGRRSVWPLSAVTTWMGGSTEKGVGNTGAPAVVHEETATFAPAAMPQPAPVRRGLPKNQLHKLLIRLRNFPL